MFRQLFKKLTSFVQKHKPVAPTGTLVTGAERDRVLASMGIRKGGSTRQKRENKYAPIAGGGPWAAARRVRAMVRTPGIHGSVNQAAVLEEYERHVRNGNVYR